MAKLDEYRTVTSHFEDLFGGMVHVKIAQLMIAAGVAGAALVGFGATANAAPTASTAAMVCVSDAGSVVAPVEANGSDQVVGTQIACDAPACAEGVLTTVVDDTGVQLEACVASAAAVPPAAAAEAMLTPPAAPTSTPPDQTSGAARLPTTGTGTGGLVIAALLVGSGSLASLLSRRRT